MATFSLPILSSIVLVVAQLSRIGVLAAGLLLIAAGIVQRHRAKARAQDCRYSAMRLQLKAEVGFARLWIATGILLGLGGLALPPIVVAIFGAIAMLFLLYHGLAGSHRSASAEKPLGLSGRSAAEECGRVRSLAETVAGVLRLRPARHFVHLANLRVKPGEIGVLQTLILSVIPIAFFVYLSLALAIAATEVAGIPDRNISDWSPQLEREPTLSMIPKTMEGSEDRESAPSYAESCPEIPDPLEIGHHLGGLFRHDGAPKAGCGDWAIEVPGTGAWVAAGSCEDELRSVAVYAPGHYAVLLYGEPARFAWSAALNGELVAAEAAEPDGGDVYLVETLDGTSAFARPSPSLEPGREEIELCSEATGTARPFAHLPPALAFLWLELIRDRTAWYWPENDPSVGQSPIAFATPGGETVARGGCDDTTCHLDVDGKRWPGGETAFVSLTEFKPYMPSAAE
ncbi:MAG TPA: hypothetical protein VF081_02360 [Solirubrobacterales bacterium]